MASKKVGMKNKLVSKKRAYGKKSKGKKNMKKRTMKRKNMKGGREVAAFCLCFEGSDPEKIMELLKEAGIKSKLTSTETRTDTTEATSPPLPETEGTRTEEPLEATKGEPVYERLRRPNTKAIDAVNKLLTNLDDAPALSDIRNDKAKTEYLEQLNELKTTFDSITNRYDKSDLAEYLLTNNLLSTVDKTPMNELIEQAKKILDEQNQYLEVNPVEGTYNLPRGPIK